MCREISYKLDKNNTYNGSLSARKTYSDIAKNPKDHRVKNNEKVHGNQPIPQLKHLTCWRNLKILLFAEKIRRIRNTVANTKRQYGYDKTRHLPLRRNNARNSLPVRTVSNDKCWHQPPKERDPVNR